MTKLPLQIPAVDGVDPEFLRILNQRLRSISDSLSTNSDQATAALATTDIAVGLHALRDKSTSTAYAESDRNALYVLATLGNGKFWTLVVAFMQGTTAQRPADLGARDKGFWFENSTLKALYQWDGTAWIFVSSTGAIAGTLAGMITLGASLAAGDAGVKFRTSDYLHTHLWTGAAWDWAPEDDGSHYFRFESATPNAGKWQKCDGSTVNWCGPTGALTAITLPNAAAGDVWPAFGNAYAGTVVAEAQGNLTGNTDSAGAHLHVAVVNNGTTSGPSATVAVQSGAGATVATDTHTHADGTTPGATSTDGAHTHGLTAAHTTAARPPKLVFLPYFRQ